MDGAQVIAHLFVEYGTVPSVIKHEADSLGKLTAQNIELAKRSDGTREIQVSVVMSAEAAISIGQFLQEKGQLVLNLRKKEI